MYQGGFLVSDVACSLIIDGCRLGLSVRLTHRHTHTHTHTHWAHKKLYISKLLKGLLIQTYSETHKKVMQQLKFPNRKALMIICKLQ